MGAHCKQEVSFVAIVWSEIGSIVQEKMKISAAIVNTTWGLLVLLKSITDLQFFKMNISLTAAPVNTSYTDLLDIAFVHFIQNLTSDNYTAWQATMTAYECSFNLCAWSFSNWSYVNGILQTGRTSQSLLNHTSGEDDPDFESYIHYQTLDPSFPANQTYTILNLDRDSMRSNFEILVETDYFVNSLYESNDDVPTGLDNLATGTTYNMMSGPNATQTLGLVTQYQTYIHVQWPWLSLSVALVVASIVLLAMTIFKTEKANLYAWKSSLEPLIFADSSRYTSEERDDARAWSQEYRSRRAKTIKEVLMI